MKDNETTKRKSEYNPGRLSYLTEDCLYYCYKYWDDSSGCMCTQKFKIGKDLSQELTVILDELDHEMDLKERYEKEQCDALVIRKSHSCTGVPNEDTVIELWDMIPDNSGNPEAVIFAETEPENPKVLKVRRVIEEECTPSQKELFHGHFGEMMQLKELAEAEGAVTGSIPSPAAMTNRKNKIIKKVAKAFGAEPVKRHQYPKRG